MFKKNEGYKQLDAFAVSTNLSKTQQNSGINQKNIFSLPRYFARLTNLYFLYCILAKRADLTLL